MRLSRSSACPELAVPTTHPARPSDPSGARATFVLYVEGPRDRSILRAWAQRLLPERGPDLLEGAVILGGRRPPRITASASRSGARSGSRRCAHARRMLRSRGPST